MRGYVWPEKQRKAGYGAWRSIFGAFEALSWSVEAQTEGERVFRLFFFRLYKEAGKKGRLGVRMGCHLRRAKVLKVYV